MNTHRTSLLVLRACTILGLLATSSARAGITAENQDVIDRLTEMNSTLTEGGVESFLAKARQQAWVAPKIFSAWYISRLEDDSDGFKRVEEAKSKFGLEYARKLSLLAKTVRETDNVTELEGASEALFDTADWFGREVGYGNMFLENRAYDIAAVAITKLIVNLSYPMEKVEAAMKRFDWGWANPANRRKVLFEESNGQHFSSRHTSITSEELDQEFREGVSLVLKLGKVQKRPDLEMFVFEDLKPGESFIVPETTWRRKAHIHIGETGFGSMNHLNLGPVHEFRKRYRKFPTKPVKYVKRGGESDIKAAFWELSWENPYGVGGAWVVYEAYLNGRLADDGYKALQRSGSAVPPVAD
jgi:hypothetical protein